MVLVGGWVRQIEALKGQLAWLKKQQFGRKSEATPANGLAGSPAGATKWSAAAGSGEGPAQGAEPVAGGGAGQTQRRRGQQPGRPGPKRQRRLYLPEETFIEFLSRRTPTKPVRATKRRFKFDWAGGLADSKRRFTRVELQHHGGHRVVARRCCRLIGRVNGDWAMNLIVIFIVLVFLHTLVSGQLERTIFTPPILFTAAGMVLSACLTSGLGWPTLGASLWKS
jgi:hypothetical protein